MPTAVSFDGETLASLDLAVGFPYGNDGPFAVSPNLRSRNNQVPIQESITWSERQLPFIVTPLNGISEALFRQRVYRYLAPFAGLRPLNVTHDDGVTDLTADVDIITLQKVQNNLFSGTFLMPDPIWRSVANSSSTSSPISYNGEFKTLPSIGITPSSSTVKKRVITVADNTGRGLSNFPILLDFNSTAGSAGATLAANYIAFVNGRSVPINVVSPDTSSTKIWIRVDVPASGSVTIDLYYGSDVTNSLAGSGSTSPFHAGGLDLASSSNSSWTWSISTTPGSGIGSYNISVQPTATGVWRPGKVGLTQDGTSYGISSETGNQLVFYVTDDTSAANDADCMILILGVKATANLTGLTRSLYQGAQIGGIVRSFVKYRTAGQNSWTTTILKSWDSTVTTPPQTESPTSSSIAITDAVEVAIGIEPAEEQPAGVLTLSGAITIALSETPTVTINSETTARLIDAILTNTTNGQYITFDKVFMDNVELTIDCLRKTIGTASGTWYGTITFVNPDDWFSLSVGSNAWSWSAGTYTTEFTYPERYLI